MKPRQMPNVWVGHENLQERMQKMTELFDAFRKALVMRFH